MSSVITGVLCGRARGCFQRMGPSSYIVRNLEVLLNLGDLDAQMFT